MPVPELHRRIDEIASRAALLAGEDPDVLAAEEHAGSGCSVCARALVNARDISADLAFLAPSHEPPPRVRERLLERARASGGVLASLKGSRASSLAPASTPGREPRVFDPSATIAHMHITGPGEAERVREIDELAAHIPVEGSLDEGDPSERVLAQIERLLGFSLHFVSIVRGDRVSYRVQRGLPREQRAFSGMRREITFCTHCVSSDGPFVVKNSGAEPFFRGNPAVSRHRIRAYVGVPLRTSKGIVVGTLCALDYRPRAIPPEIVRVLELFAQRVVAELERPRGVAQLEALVLDPPRGAIYRRGWFGELLTTQLARFSSEGRSASLIAVSGRSSEDLASVAARILDTEVAGEIDEGVVGILLAGSGAEQAKARCEALASAARGSGLSFTFAAADGAKRTAADWIDAARARSSP